MERLSFRQYLFCSFVSFACGLFFVIVAVASILGGKCNRLIPDCPVTSITALGPIGLCRADYTYEVDGTSYAGSQEIACQPNNNNTIAVCYDRHRPWRHKSSTDWHGAGLYPEQYDIDIGGFFFGIALLSPCVIMMLVDIVVRLRLCFVPVVAREATPLLMTPMKRSDSARDVEHLHRTLA